MSRVLYDIETDRQRYSVEQYKCGITSAEEPAMPLNCWEQLGNALTLASGVRISETKTTIEQLKSRPCLRIHLDHLPRAVTTEDVEILVFAQDFYLTYLRNM